MAQAANPMPHLHLPHPLARHLRPLHRHRSHRATGTELADGGGETD